MFTNLNLASRTASATLLFQHGNSSSSSRVEEGPWSQSFRLLRSKNLVRAEEDCETGEVPVFWPDHRRYSVRDAKGLEYGARPGGTYGTLSFLNESSSGSPPIVRKDSTQLKDLKRFAQGVQVATVAANRPSEDRYSITEFENTGKDGIPSCLVASIFDGHGGYQVSSYLAKEVKEMFQDVYLPKDGLKSAEKSILHAYKEAERLLWSWVEPIAAIGFSGVVKVGSCGISAVVLKDKDNKATNVVVANVGDCRCILARGKKSVPLSTIHNANEPSERENLRKKFVNDQDIVQCQSGWQNKKSGKQLQGRNPSGDPNEWVPCEFSCYIKGCLQPSRTFGDFYMKYPQVSYDRELNTPFFANTPDKSSFPFVSAEPEIKVIDISSNDTFLVLASDGLWDFISDTEVAEMLHPYISNPSTNLAQLLLDKVLERAAKEAKLGLSQLKQLPAGNVRRRLHDDTTIIVIRL